VKPVNVLICGDIHNGHILGLNKPKYFNNAYPEITPLRVEFYNWWIKETKSLGIIDYCISNGDAVDGSGRKGNTFHDTTNMGKQVEYATEILQDLKATYYLMTYGSSYHVHDNMDFEKLIADNLGADIRSSQKIEWNGVRFYFKHVPGGKSGVPRGGDLGIKGGVMWTLLKDMKAKRETADYCVFNHIHEQRYIELEGLPTGVVCPCLKLGISEYEPYARGLSGYYAVGFYSVKIYDRDRVEWKKHIFKYSVETDGYRKLK